MILPTYSNRVWPFILCLLVAAPCAAHKVHDHSKETAQPERNQPLSVLTQHYTQHYLLTGNDAALDALELELKHTTADPSQALLANAWLAQARHQFEQSLQILNQVIHKFPHNGQAWLSKANVLNVQGELDQAQHACKQVLRHVSLQAGLLCQARLARNKSEKQRAYKTVQALTERGIADEFKSWGEAIAAELAASLDLRDEAEHYFRASLEGFQAVQVRTSYMDFLIANERFADALNVSQNSGNPALRIRELIASKKLDYEKNGSKHHKQDTHLNDAIRNTHRQFRHWQRDKDYQHAREMAMFYLDVMLKPQLALTLAEINLQNQKEPEDVALLQRAQQTLQNNKRTNRDS